MFRDGRTETVRSCTKEAMTFIRYMTDETTGDVTIAQELCRAACRSITALSLDASLGRGVDRHLFALNVAAKGLEIQSDFLDYVHNKVWFQFFLGHFFWTFKYLCFSLAK
jgi:hypothetical protein